MKPFLILQLRGEDAASDNELQAFLKHGDLTLDDVKRVRMEKQGIPSLDLDNYSGIIIGGGPFNVSDDQAKKSSAQIKMESDLQKLFDEVDARDFPFLGACYGIGFLAKYLGGEVSKEKYAEEVGELYIKLTEEAANDDLLKDLPREFLAFGGHKEACQNLPAQTVHLAKSDNCPIQAIRYKNNIYGFQFHPELDVEGIVLRINVYKNAGYFPPENAQALIEKCNGFEIVEPPKILKKFIDKYKK